MKTREKIEWVMTALAILSLAAVLYVLVLKTSAEIREHGLKGIVEEVWYGKGEQDAER